MDIDNLISRLVHAKSVDRVKKDVGSLRRGKDHKIFYQDGKNSLPFEFAFLPLACMISAKLILLSSVFVYISETYS